MSKPEFDSTVYLILANVTKNGITCRVIQREAKKRPTTYVTDNGRVIKLANLEKFDSQTIATSPSCYTYTDDVEQVGLLVEAAACRLRKAVSDLFGFYFDQMEATKKSVSVSFSRTEKD